MIKVFQSATRINSKRAAEIPKIQETLLKDEEQECSRVRLIYFLIEVSRSHSQEITDFLQLLARELYGNTVTVYYVQEEDEDDDDW